MMVVLMVIVMVMMRVVMVVIFSSFSQPYFQTQPRSIVGSWLISSIFVSIFSIFDVVSVCRQPIKLLLYLFARTNSPSDCLLFELHSTGRKFDV